MRADRRTDLEVARARKKLRADGTVEQVVGDTQSCSRNKIGLAVRGSGRGALRGV